LAFVTNTSLRSHQSSSYCLGGPSNHFDLLRRKTLGELVMVGFFARQGHNALLAGMGLITIGLILATL
jgi:hypothetical protein